MHLIHTAIETFAVHQLTQTTPGMFLLLQFYAKIAAMILGSIHDMFRL